MIRVFVRLILAVIFLGTLLSEICRSQETSPVNLRSQSTLEPALGFEVPLEGGKPQGWDGGPDGTLFLEGKIVHGGKSSARIERNASSPNNFSTFTKSLPIDFTGSSLELRGFLRTEDVTDFSGLWMREDGEEPALAFDNMQAKQIKGSTDWTEYSITLALKPEATKLYFGFLMGGTGKTWGDDLQLLLDGKPIWEARHFERPRSVVDMDHQFDNGSGVSISQLTPIQIDNLVTLGKVWGFLKYHHPKVTSGQIHWDYELFRVLPAVLASSDRKTASALFAEWIEKLGPVPQCSSCAKLEGNDIDFRPDLDWIRDPRVLGSDLSETLQSIYTNRVPEQQFYLSMVATTHNPDFQHELAYPFVKLPDAGFQLLGLYRFWNIAEYWSPYRDVIGENWNQVHAEFIPRVMLAKNAQSYQQEMMAAIARLHDGHAALWSSLQNRPPIGKCQLPIKIRFVQNQPVVVASSSSNTTAAALQVGDVITDIGGILVSKLVHNWMPYYSGSNEAARLRDIANGMTRGDCGDLTLRVERNRQMVSLTLKRDAPVTWDFPTHDLAGPTFRLLSKDVAYLKLSSVQQSEAAHYIQQAAGTKGLIIDIRNYPSQFMVFALGGLLVDSSRTFARFTEGDLSNPGAYRWGDVENLQPLTPHYAGKVVVVVDEVSQSQAEYTAMAFHASRNTVIVGSTTAGADGNVSRFSLPGGLSTMISGIGVFYPDKAPTQRLGIIPNVNATPTIAGIRAGRDEVLESGIRQILGNEVSETQIEKISKP
jgi:C-terminal processing protease CtpA/Prc